MPEMKQIGTCIVFSGLSGQPAAKCCQCPWDGAAIYDYDLARQVAEHSRSHFYSEPCPGCGCLGGGRLHYAGCPRMAA